MITVARCAPLVALLLVAAGCGGSGQTPPAKSPATPPATAPLVHATFTMHWGGTASQAAHRTPKYVAPTTRSLAIFVNGGTAQITNAPPVGQPQTTNIAIDAPAGVDTFTIITYDETNGAGNVLSHAVVSQRINPDVPNVLSATLNGVVAALQVSLGTPTPNAGSSASSTVVVTALDADGNAIVGPGDYSTPIKLGIQDPLSSGTLTLSTTLLQTPGTPVTLTYTGGTLSGANVVASASGVPAASASFTPKPTITEYALSNSSASPFWITPGPDGNMWFTEFTANAVGKITMAGVITEFPVPTPNAGPYGIVAGQDGQLWFTEFITSKIGSVTTSGAFVEQPTKNPNDGPGLIIERGNGYLWYAGTKGSDIGVQGETGGPGSIAIVPAASPFALTAAPDGNVYWTATATGTLGNVTPATKVNKTAVGGYPTDVVSGPDGNLWYTDSILSQIVQFSPSSNTVLNHYPTPTLSAGPTAIVVGKDGALWFSEYDAGKIGRITVTGAVTEYAMPSAASGVKGIAVAPDGSIWAVEQNTGKIARLVY